MLELSHMQLLIINQIQAFSLDLLLKLRVAHTEGSSLGNAYVS